MRNQPSESPAVRWVGVTRANFLVLPVMLVAIGGAGAWHDGMFSIARLILTLIGVMLAHVSVNLFNEYSDWRTGIDEHTPRTPFSGGSGTLQKGALMPVQVRAAAWGSLGGAFLIGLWLAWQAGWPVLALMAAGGIATVWYTDVLARYMVGEVASGITLGSLVVLGAYFVQTGTFSTAMIWVSVPPGILTMLLLLLNEFPDAVADKAGGRRHLVIVLGHRAASWIYAGLMLGVYVTIGAGVALGVLPTALLVGCLTLPVAMAAAVLAVRFAGEPAKLVPAQGMNVVVVLLTDLLLAAGFLLA